MEDEVVGGVVIIVVVTNIERWIVIVMSNINKTCRYIVREIQKGGIVRDKEKVIEKFNYRSIERVGGEKRRQHSKYSTYYIKRVSCDQERQKQSNDATAYTIIEAPYRMG